MCESVGGGTFDCGDKNERGFIQIQESLKLQIRVVTTLISPQLISENQLNVCVEAAAQAEAAQPAARDSDVFNSAFNHLLFSPLSLFQQKQNAAKRVSRGKAFVRLTRHDGCDDQRLPEETRETRQCPFLPQQKWPRTKFAQKSPKISAQTSSSSLRAYSNIVI